MSGMSNTSHTTSEDESHAERLERLKSPWGTKTQQQLAILMLDESDIEVDSLEASFELGIRDKVLLFFDDPSFHPVAKAVSVGVMVLIVLSILTICLETVESINQEVGHVLRGTEQFCVTIFTLEFLVRFSCARKKLKFLSQFLNIVDLLAILPFYLGLVLQSSESGGFGAFRAIRLVRVLRVMKMSKYTSGVEVLFKALQISMQPLAVLSFFVLIAVIIFSALMYYVEKDAIDPATGAPSNFTSIPKTFWWCIVTITTVGYGDVFPITTLGKTLGIGVMLAGVLLLALPITVIGANFTKSLRDSQVLAMERALRDADIDLPNGEVSVAEMESVLKKLSRRGGSKEMLLGRAGTVRDLLLKYDTDGSGAFNQAEMVHILQDFQMLCAGAAAFQLDQIEEMRQVNDHHVRAVLSRIDDANNRAANLTEMIRKNYLDG